jgi:poly(3-hydroxybutyrate) depolymerase
MRTCTALATASISVTLALAACGDDTSGSGQGGAGASGTGGAGASGQGGATSSGASTSSSNGAGGDAGAGGSNASGGGEGGGAPSGSEGCGRASSDPLGQWVEKTIDVEGTSRTYFVRLPSGYDPATPYPVVYQFHGCSSSATKENNNVPLEALAGSSAILVRGRAVGECWDTAAAGPDVAFFDALVAALESTSCADPTRRFVAGYSSGAFMTHRLACVRGDQIRGVASIAGGMGGNGCSGAVAALLIHDEGDATVNISASQQARDAHLGRNGCEATSQATEPSPCVRYDGCDAGLPVVWCQTQGQGHARQDTLASGAFWGFFSGL